MTLTLTLYFITGLVLASFYWELNYEKEYRKLIAKGEKPETGMAVILLTIITILWPIFLLWMICSKKL